jgi:uncharacterized protein YegP (UPF0339 family)
MTNNREILKAQRAHCEGKAHSLKSYIKELKEMAAKHGTDEALIEEDLRKAAADMEYYEGQMGHAADALGDDPAARRAFRVYRDAAGEWRWRLVAGNGQLIAESGESYQNKPDCLHGIELVKASADARVEDGD